MAIPDYQTVMLPLLRFAEDKQEHSVRDAVDALADEFKLTTEERRELLPSGQQEIFTNRVGWARLYLNKAGLFETPKRGFLQITERGLQVLKENPKKINAAFLDRFP